MKREKTPKTNAMRLLENEQVPYRVETYEVDESNLSGVHAADQLGEDPDQVFKTLVLTDEKGEHAVCCIPVAYEIDLKKAARAFGVKRLEMLPLKELLPLTGYVRGGCSPLGMKRHFRTMIDEAALLFDEIAVSAGERGVQMIVAPEGLARAAQADFADLVALPHR